MTHSKSDFLSHHEPVTKHCSKCGCRIPVSSPYDDCKECMKRELFPKVKEFINENEDVNEMILAEALGIDKVIIHEWIQEGHLEYRGHHKP